MKNREMIYVTFNDDTIYDKRRVAVECETEEQAHEVALDLNSMEGVKNIRLNRCGKLRKHFVIFDYQDYYTARVWDRTIK